MLATSEGLEIQESVEELAAQILQSEVADEYRRCLYKLQRSKDTQRKIQEFNKMKELYEEVQRFGRYHPDYKRVMMEIRQLKRDMDLDDNVANFRRAENDLQDLLDQVSVIIGKSVSENVKVPTGNPFFDSGSACGGGCGSGGSCGCS
ncbi:YlbF family regulator [Bacillus salacetis]|uniref:YlbF family regulator n=1 Tax=Bacillus salacetis TaxID=2315464 RepID=A0A3A1QLU3_9BACI|nr:YlbF family regulator [Bacillus salacetis]RIW27451.1 YlbF family regulator [Bacillus salacetis]